MTGVMVVPRVPRTSLTHSDTCAICGCKLTDESIHLLRGPSIPLKRRRSLRGSFADGYEEDTESIARSR